MSRTFFAATALVLSASVALSVIVNTSSANAQTNPGCRPGKVCIK